MANGSTGWITYGILVYGYVAKRYTVTGHVILWCAATRHLAVRSRFHILCCQPSDIDIWIR